MFCSVLFLSLRRLLALALFLSPPVLVAHTSFSNAITENTEVFLYSLVASSRPLRFYTICLWEQEVCHRPVSAQSSHRALTLVHLLRLSTRWTGCLSWYVPSSLTQHHAIATDYRESEREIWGPLWGCADITTCLFTRFFSKLITDVLQSLLCYKSWLCVWVSFVCMCG